MTPFGVYEVRQITRKLAVDFNAQVHYAKHPPPTVKVALGLFKGEHLVGVSMWGVGVRPLHTIQAIFPSLTAKDYLELNRLCVSDSEPRNTESWFLARCAEFLKGRVPVLFSWADGMRGKPGYVYQASCWLYGGFIKSEFYITSDNEIIHPRLLITRYGSRGVDIQKKLGLSKLWGYQFRYIRFLCGNAQRKRLLAESPFTWTQDYPKQSDMRFWIQPAGEVSREIRELPKLEGAGRFRTPAPLFEGHEL